jgi:4-amino-4-deoxy-L-arabinose transferase-like glycosyltransferase
MGSAAVGGEGIGRGGAVAPVVVTLVVSAPSEPLSEDPPPPHEAARSAPRARTATARVAAVRDRRRWLLVAIPIVIGVVIRLWYLWGVQRNVCPPPSWETGVPLPSRCPGDSYVYHYGADLVAQGKGFVIPTDFRLSGGLDVRAGADHPPLFTLVLAAFSFIGAKSWLWHEHVVIAMGALNIGLAGMLGRRVAGRFRDDRSAQWVGFCAAMFMAVYPYVWLSDVMVLSETLAMTANLAVALLCYRVLKDTNLVWVVALGAAAGAAALVRAEMVLLGPLLIVPMLLRVRVLSFRQQAGRIVLAGVVMLGVISPWLIRNMTVYDNPTTMSTGTGITLANTNCDDTYYGPTIGFWSLACIPPLPWNRPVEELEASDPAQLRTWVDQSGIDAPADATPEQLVAALLDHAETADQSDDEVYLRAVGLEYLSENRSRLPVVAAVRFGRMWGLYRPLQQVELEDAEGRPENEARIGLVMFYPLMGLAVGGTVVLARRREPLLPLLVPVGIVTFAAISAFGQSRYRAPAEPLLMVLAAVGLMAFLGWVRSRGGDEHHPPATEATRPDVPADA